MQILITGKGMELTPAIEEYVNKKISALEKFFSPIVKAEVVVGRETAHHLKGEVYLAECKLSVTGKDVFASKNEKDLYKAIDKIRDYLESELKKHKEKLHGNERQAKVGARSAKEYQPEE